ncbi:hypothetical protein ATCC90586_005344 [Pythium insidiosum]|nr:hypothetical protein ATCC90586_005344 [Pythium insidiosum]
MVNWWSVVAAAAAFAVALSPSPVEAAALRSTRLRVHISHAAKDTRDCEINGLTLRHHSLHYFSDKTYVACSHGRAGCYVMDRAHDHARQISCPSDGADLQRRIDAHRQKEEQEAEDERRRRRLSLAVSQPERQWENGVVCFQFHDQYPFDSAQTAVIYDAMRVYEKETNVRFMTLDTCKSKGLTAHCKGCVNYIDLKHPPTGRDCNSSIGVNTRGGQIMNLADRCFEGDGALKHSTGTTIHEIGHALGLYHEHQHPQRRVAVFWDDIPQSIWGEMKVRDVSVGGKYDPDSIMHYPQSYGFCFPKFCGGSVQTDCVPPDSKFCGLNDDPATCVQPRKELCDSARTSVIGQRRYLSKGDLDALKALYKTPAAWPAAESLIPKL